MGFAADTTRPAEAAPKNATGNSGIFGKTSPMASPVCRLN
jgi:hypothetical protein